MARSCAIAANCHPENLPSFTSGTRDGSWRRAAVPLAQGRPIVVCDPKVAPTHRRRAIRETVKVLDAMAPDARAKAEVAGVLRALAR